MTAWLVLHDNVLHSEWHNLPNSEFLPKGAYIHNTRRQSWYYLREILPMPINLADVPKVYRLLVLVLGHSG